MLKLNFEDSLKKHFSELGILTIYGLYVLESVIAVRTEYDLPKLCSTYYFTGNRNKVAIPNHSLQFFWKAPKSAGSFLIGFHKV